MTVITPRNLTEKEIALISSRFLASYSPNYQTSELKLSPQETITIPAKVLPQLMEILKYFAEGNQVKIVPIKEELTTTEAAEILNVSRPYLVNLLETGMIPFRKVGVHRRILLQDLMAYKEDIDIKRSSVLAELTAQAQELNMGY
jgi:excisionase family DNA binding protein